MIRTAFLLGLLFAVPFGFHPAHSQAATGFDAQAASGIYNAALSFLAPRIVDPEPVSKLTEWGLRGLTALDPQLTVTTKDGAIVLASRKKTVFHADVPKDDTVAAWVPIAVQLTGAAAQSSGAVQRAGTAVIVQAFFDEMCNHLDPYTRYVAPVEAGEDREQRSGRAGIGITLVPKGAVVAVADVVRDGPAAAAGIRPGDVVVAIAGEPVRGLGASAVESMILGPEDTQFSLTWRGHDGKSHEANFSRTIVPAETVFAERSDTVLTIRIAGFNNTTDVHLAQRLQDGLAGDDPPDGIVIDLRGNRGGLLRQAVTVADEFLPDGLIVSTVGRAPDSDHVWRSTPGELGEGLPLIVLVDGHTASAAEVLAAALADRGRAVVVGSATFGKGLVQTIAQMPDGGELHVTWSRMLAPRGWPIQGLGVMPQVCTSLGTAVTEQELNALAAGSQPMLPSLAASRAARPPLTPARIQEIRNACPASEGRADDMAVARQLIANPAAYAAALLPPMR